MADKFQTTKKRALLLYGGWEGHQPEIFADFAEQQLLGEFEVVRSRDLGILQAETLAGFDLLLPHWTFGTLNESQETALLNAVRDGLGVVAWHGNASAFLENRPHKLMLGGQFVGHPGGNEVSYPVHFLDNDPLVAGLADFTVVSEQYYLLIDPAVKVLATCTIDGAEQHWLKGVPMPVAWKRQWGQGRVFYCALGHTLAVLQQTAIATLLARALKWAVRRSAESF